MIRWARRAAYLASRRKFLIGRRGAGNYKRELQKRPPKKRTWNRIDLIARTAKSPPPDSTHSAGAQLPLSHFSPFCFLVIPCAIDSNIYACPRSAQISSQRLTSKLAARWVATIHAFMTLIYVQGGEARYVGSSCLPEASRISTLGR